MPLAEPGERAVTDGIEHDRLLRAVYLGGEPVLRVAHSEIKEHAAAAADIRRKVGGTAEVRVREDRTGGERTVGHGGICRGGKRKPRQRDAAVKCGDNVVFKDADAKIVENALCRIGTANAHRVRKRGVDPLAFGRL